MNRGPRRHRTEAPEARRGFAARGNAGHRGTETQRTHRGTAGSDRKPSRSRGIRTATVRRGVTLEQRGAAARNLREKTRNQRSVVQRHRDPAPAPPLLLWGRGGTRSHVSSRMPLLLLGVSFTACGGAPPATGDAAAPGALPEGLGRRSRSAPQLRRHRTVRDESPAELQGRGHHHQSSGQGGAARRGRRGDGRDRSDRLSPQPAGRRGRPAPRAGGGPQRRGGVSSHARSLRERQRLADRLRLGPEPARSPRRQGSSPPSSASNSPGAGSTTRSSGRRRPV